MKKNCLFVLAFLCLSVVASAQTEVQPAEAAASTPSAVAGLASTPAEPPVEQVAAKQDGPSVKSTCTAYCWDGSQVSGSCPGGTCTAQDSNCDAGIQGEVRCNGVLCASCPACPPPGYWCSTIVDGCNRYFDVTSGCCVSDLTSPRACNFDFC